MAEVTWSSEALKEPAWLKANVAAAVHCILEGDPEHSESVARVESIAFDAEALRVSTDVRIMPVLTNVKIELVFGEEYSRAPRRK